MARQINRQRRPRFTAFSWSVAASVLALPSLLVWAGTSGGAAPVDKARSEAALRASLEKQFAGTVQPFMKSYCTPCHGKEKPAAQLDFTAYTTMASVIREYPHWALVVEKLGAKQMPPSDFGKQPTMAQRTAVMNWIRGVRQYEANRNAGDPGPVLARRLSNAEYDYTIRDLTGVDLHPTREFPVDPANPEGFDNSWESLTFSPALMKKYVAAAKDISDHMALTSTGLEFATHPVIAETDRDKFGILRIVDFYKRQPTDLADYFRGAWRYKNRAALGAPNATLKTVAADMKISPRYLETVWNLLNGPAEKVGPVARLQTQWNALPAPTSTNLDAVREGCVTLRDWTQGLRKKVASHYNNLPVPRGFSSGGQCFVLWKDREYATHRRDFNSAGLQIDGVPASHRVPPRGNRPEKVTVDPVDPDLFAPLDETARAPYQKEFTRFCDVFPDAFYISERGRMFVDEPGDKGRLLAAGLHNSMGYFRDDTPLMDMILDEAGRQELNHLWLDFNMVAFIPERMHLEFFVYERAESQTMADPEFNFARAEDKDATSDAKIKRLADLYLAKAERNGGQPLALQAIREHFQWVSTTIRGTERSRLAAEAVHRKALVDFAARAYRRPLTEAERTDLLAFYKSLRQKEGLNHEEAMRDSVMRVLISPNFLFRMNLEASSDSPSPLRTVATTRRPITPPATTKTTQPLPDYALANRLSYFLWSSMPDKELLAHAAAGDLHRPEMLATQTRRMMRDPRVQALALEFGGNWLDFRRFEEHNAVDRERFPTFNDNLREAMFQEPLHFLMDEFQNDRSVLDMLYGKHTFVNAPLAKHYGMTDVKVEGNEWVRIENADKYGRGGLLPMSVFLTKNSSGLRTSPVRRGYWVVRRVLGEYIPPPPAVVPELPKDEGKLGDKTLREALAQHRANPACASCHARFDSYGLVFEGYGPIGELRAKDLGGKPINDWAPFPGGKDRSGLTGLRDYVHQQRQKDFLDNVCRKLLAYGLGRSLQPSDDATLLAMQQKLIANNYRFSAMIETIVTSKQFLNRRAPAASPGVALTPQPPSLLRSLRSQGRGSDAEKPSPLSPPSLPTEWGLVGKGAGGLGQLVASTKE